jgi:O-antigen/teichoic acid export membrane protein
MSSSPKASPVAARIITHVQTPLFRNAYAWLVSTGLSSGLGILYWILAARHYPAERVGFSAALISSLVFIAGVSQLNLTSALTRFLPTAGQRTARLTAGAYGVAVGLALLTSTAFVALDVRLPQLDFFGSDLRLAAVFIPATMAWSIFTLQDGALTGLRAAVWVPVDNIGYSLLKVGLLLWLARVLPEWGIFLSWVVPAAVMVVPMNLLIFGRLIPKHRRNQSQAAAWVRVGELGRYIASNYLGSLFTLISGRLLPVLVVAVMGPASTAYFYLAWTIANAVKLVTVQMATSLTVEGALDQVGAAANGSKFLRLMAGLLIPFVLALVVAAPWVLRLSGPAYAAEGVPVLRWLSLSIIPGVVVSVYLSLARVRQQLRQIVLAEGALAVLSLGLSYVLLRPLGVTGVGIAFMVSTTLLALALLPSLWPTVHAWRSQPQPGLD